MDSRLTAIPLCLNWTPDSSAPPAPEITGLGLPQGDAPDQFLGPEGGQIDPLNLEIDPPTEPGGTEIARVDQSGNDSGNSGNDGASTGGGESTVSPTSTIVNTRPTANDDYQNGGGAQGDVVSGNVIAGGGADIDAEANDLSLLDMTFEGTTYSFEGDGQTDEGGTFVNVTGNNGDLKIYSDGSYDYTKNANVAELGDTTAGGGSRANAGDWADGGVSLLAYDFGTAFVDANGQFDAAAADDTVRFASRGAGVDGTQNGASSSSEIQYDPISGDSEALALMFDTNVSQARVTLYNISSTEASGEEGDWFAYDSGNNLVGQGHIDSNTIDYMTTTRGELTIDFGGISFQSVVFNATAYDSGGTSGGSDYYVQSVSYDAAPQTADPDIFSYTVTDGDLTDTANLTIFDSSDGVDRIFVDDINGAVFNIADNTASQAYGNSGADVLNASAVSGSVYLAGNGGNDILTGGDGNDLLVGGGGVDTFVYLNGHGTDTIADFEFGEQLLIQGNGFQAEQLNFVQSGNDTVISFEGAETAAFILTDVDVATFDNYSATTGEDGVVEVAPPVA